MAKNTNQNGILVIQPNKQLIMNHRPLMSAPSEFLLSVPMLAAAFIEQHGADNISREDFKKIRTDVDNAVNELAIRN